jgi:lipopolysaccharide assembly outer membrane protein LptD (OstA)
MPSISGKFLRVNSLKQIVLDEDKIIFEGAVEALIDQKLHLCADRVEVDRKAQTLIASMDRGGPVKLENNEFIILTDYLFLDLAKKTGYAKNIKIHMDEGFISAKVAEKLDDLDWRMEDILFSACDQDDLHWYFKADTAVVHGSYFIKSSNIFFKIGGIPFFYMPGMVFPIQGRSKSGFLIPKFSFDYDLGFGMKLEYYKHINPHCDTTLGIDFKTKRGAVFSDEFRWARSPSSFTNAYGQYAIVNDSYALQSKNIVQKTQHRYWVQGKDFSYLTRIGLFDIRSLIRADFGTDKNIGYYFYNNIEEVDDTFFNSIIFRGLSNKQLLELKGDKERTSRKQFVNLSDEEYDFSKKFVNDSCLATKKEIEDRFRTIKLPHFEWSPSSWSCNNILFYRHDLFFDQIFYRQVEVERLFVNSRMIKESSIIPLEKHDVFRAGYKGNFHSVFNLKNNTVRLFVEPEIQFRSNTLTEDIHKKNVIEGHLFGQGAYRIYAKYGAQWMLPGATRYSDDFSCVHFSQPSVKWTFLPKFYQKNWYYMDLWDRAYPIHEISCNLRNDWNWKDWSVGLDLEQSYDFYNKNDIFYLRRGVKQRHILPFNYDFSVGWDVFKVSLNQEFEWGSSRLLQSQILAGIFKDKLNFSVGYLYQHPLLQQSRELLSNIPHFILMNIAIPLGKEVILCYEGQFYDEKGSHFLDLRSLKPLIHRIKMEINGHCWGCYVGFEEKKYREYGNRKAEHSFVFSLRLDSLGSFAKKFRRPAVIHKED